ncbi:alpha-E domain-containing protein [bacterium]|nr:alpha-E domain-containing protein [bacterium]
MLSRVADSTYWMARCVERADNVARFIDVNLNLMLDLPEGYTQQWDPLVNTTGDHELFEKRFGKPDQEKVIWFLTFDRDNPNSILSCLHAARENARSIREIITTTMWEELNSFYLKVKAAAGTFDGSDRAYQFYPEVKRGSHLFQGATDSTLQRNEAWHFLEMGRMIERADKTSRILDVKYYFLLRSISEVGSPFDELQWAAVLRSASAFEMYRKRHGRLAPAGITHFLLLDDQFPRAVRCCLDRARHSLHAITGTPLGSFHNNPERLFGQLCSDLAFTNVDEIEAQGLHEYLDELQEKVNLIGTGIHETFFTRKSPTSVRPRARGTDDWQAQFSSI